MLVLTTAELRVWLGYLASAAAPTQPGPLDGVSLHLYKTDVVPAPDMVLADFTPADFPGYAPSVEIAWSLPVAQEDTSAGVSGSAETFVATGAEPSNTIYGYYLQRGTTLIAAERFASPVPIADTGRGLTVVPKIELAGLI